MNKPEVVVEFLNIDWKNKKLIPPSYNKLYEERKMSEKEKKEIFINNGLKLPDKKTRKKLKTLFKNPIDKLLESYQCDNIFENQILIKGDNNSLFMINGEVKTYGEMLDLYKIVKNKI